jgi:7-dehydrocholesterol reductase
MVLVNLFHFMYVVDFFWHEDWYLRTIDMAHDHFGFYFAWGDTVWLPWMYTLQSHYLVRNPVVLSPVYTAFVLFVGFSGYYIFRAVNNQKDIVRSTDGKCKIWGKAAQVIRTVYQTSDGKTHKSLLLCSGFWGRVLHVHVALWCQKTSRKILTRITSKLFFFSGLSRHFNYVGDLLLSSAMCLSCGFGHLLPYFYIIYMTILLVSRIYRDDARCRGKYGKYWEMYCDRVQFKLIPYVW